MCVQIFTDLGLINGHNYAAQVIKKNINVSLIAVALWKSDNETGIPL